MLIQEMARVFFGGKFEEKKLKASCYSSPTLCYLSRIMQTEGLLITFLDRVLFCCTTATISLH